MAIGNIVGSNIFNILFVLGATAVVRPLPSGGISYVDYCVMTFSAILFWIMGWLVGKRTVTRGEGALLLILYGCYMAWIIING